MKKMLGLFLMFVLFAVLGFFLIGFQNSVPTTNLSVTANATFTSQSAAMNVSYTGLNAILYILIAAMVIGAAYFLFKTVTRKW